MTDLKLTSLGKKHRKAFYQKLESLGTPGIKKKFIKEHKRQSKEHCCLHGPIGFDTKLYSKTWKNTYLHVLNRQNYFRYSDVLLLAFEWEKASSKDSAFWIKQYGKLVRNHE